jgi:hypothetical protein
MVGGRDKTQKHIARHIQSVGAMHAGAGVSGVSAVRVRAGYALLHYTCTVCGCRLPMYAQGRAFDVCACATLLCVCMYVCMCKEKKKKRKSNSSTATAVQQ